MHCPRCQGEDCVHIEIGLQGEDNIQFFACRFCEARWWEHEGDPIDLDRVLEIASRNEFK